MDPQYFEIFHSKPSWGTTYVQRRDASSSTGWANPSPADALVDATHIREQFRVYRGDLRDVKGGRLEFVLSNGGPRDWEVPPDSPEGWFVIEGSGRYVIEHGCRRVGDVDFDSVHEIAGWITPVPGGVGPVTLSILMRNTVAAVEAQKLAYESRMLAGD